MLVQVKDMCDIIKKYIQRHLYDILMKMKEEKNPDKMCKYVKQIVPTYVLPEEWKNEVKSA